MNRRAVGRQPSVSAPVCVPLFLYSTIVKIRRHTDSSRYTARPGFHYLTIAKNPHSYESGYKETSHLHRAKYNFMSSWHSEFLFLAIHFGKNDCSSCSVFCSYSPMPCVVAKLRNSGLTDHLVARCRCPPAGKSSSGNPPRSPLKQFAGPRICDGFRIFTYV